MVIFAHLIQSASSLPTDTSALESSVSALERQITALESSSIPLEQLLPWFTGLVALGVAMEFWLIWRERFDEMEAWARGTIRSPERPSFTQFAVAILSVLLITGGIVGELWVGIKITSINGIPRSKNAELRSDSDQLLALVTQQAGDAAKSAKNARDEADSLKGDIKTAKEQSAAAESDLADALERTARAQAELNRLKSPRIITNASIHVSALQAYKGTEYTFVGVFSDAESLALLRQTDNLLVLSGWKRVQAKIPGGNRFIFEDISILPIVFTGVRVEVESTETVETLRAKPTPLLPSYIQAGIILKSELAAAISPVDEGLRTREYNVEQGTSMAVKLWIGQKP